MNVLDLFSGIGGFSLGLESAGMRTVAFCEREPYCQAVLRKHWPDVPIHDDVRTLDGKQYAGAVDVVCGGFPCQDISYAGKGAGLAGERSGLWFEFHRLISEIRPRYAIIENVSALRSRGLDAVLRSLSEIGYDAEWHCIPASAVGAPHRRDRVWIVAYPSGGGRKEGLSSDSGEREQTFGERTSIIASRTSKASAFMADAQCFTRDERYDGIREEAGCQGRLRISIGTGCNDVADAARVQSGREEQRAERERIGQGCQSILAPMADADSKQTEWITEPRLQRNPWIVEPDVGRVAHGIPHRVDRLRALGNAIVPQIAALIGEAIMRYEEEYAR